MNFSTRTDPTGFVSLRLTQVHLLAQKSRLLPSEGKADSSGSTSAGQASNAQRSVVIDSLWPGDLVEPETGWPTLDMQKT